YAFFFQAEDGIRDFHVTGVQTCALPIYEGTRQAQGLPQHHRSVGEVIVLTGGFQLRWCPPVHVPPGWGRDGGHAEHGARSPAPRSEERRVGKECRSGWVLDHCTRKRMRR